MKSYRSTIQVTQHCRGSMKEVLLAYFNFTGLWDPVRVTTISNTKIQHLYTIHTRIPVSDANNLTVST